jgi:hypothetical protein
MRTGLVRLASATLKGGTHVRNYAKKICIRTIWVLSILTLYPSLPGLLAEDAKLKVEDIVARHQSSPAGQSSCEVKTV